MTSSLYQPSKKDLLDWASSLLELELNSLEDFISGAVWTQILDAYHTNTVPMTKVDFHAHTYEQSMINYKILQQVFAKLDIPRDVDVQRMLDGNQGAILEFLQWLSKYLRNKSIVSNYDPRGRRRMSKHGSCDSIPRYGVSEAAFKRWRMKDANLEYAPVPYAAMSSMNLNTNWKPLTTRQSVLRSGRDSMSEVSLPYRGTRHASHDARMPLTPTGHVPRHHSSSRAPVERNGLKTGGSERLNALGGALYAAEDGSKALTLYVPMLKRLVSELRHGEHNTCISRGCIRSLQDLLATVARHSVLLLKECSLRLDVWGENHDEDVRAKIKRLMSALMGSTQAVSAATEELRGAERSLDAPGTGSSGQPHASHGSVSHAATELNNTLRAIGGVQAELPAVWHPLTMPKPDQLARMKLDAVNAATLKEMEGATPEFLTTSTSHACKVGPFQFRKLKNGDVYKGRYARSKKFGDGCYYFLNGDAFEGQFKDDHMEGAGVYTFSGQGRYEGSWVAAHYSGFGTETFAKGTTYIGQYAQGNRMGFGVCRYFNGDYYEGTWGEGVRNGCGMQQCIDGSNYVGHYKDAKREGLGVYTFHNGDCYLGQYKQDLPNGVGVYLFEKGQKYMGEWQDGKKHGLCEYMVESGERYVGEWEQGKPKWVQVLPQPGLEQEPLSQELQEKVDKALLIANSAREKAASSQAIAAEHWDARSHAQHQILHAVDKAVDSATSAQGARTRAMALAHRLDVAIVEHVGEDGWPSTTAAN